MDIGKIEQLTTHPMTADQWMRQRLWVQLPQRGLLAEELNHLREFLNTKGLWDEYQAWVRGVVQAKYQQPLRVKDAVLAAALLVDTIYMEYSTFAMPKELRQALNTLHQRVRDLAVSQEAEPAQKSLALEDADA